MKKSNKKKLKKNKNISVANWADHEGSRAEKRESGDEAQKGNGIQVEEGATETVSSYFLKNFQHIDF